MDAVTHVLIAVAAGLLTRRWVPEPLRPAWVPTVGAAGLAPDLDVFISPLALWEPLYFMGHRGITHSLVGAPLAAFLFVRILCWARWHRLAVFRWDRRLWPALVLGGWTHLPLDMIAMKGAPVFLPFSDAYVSNYLFYWMVLWLAPISFFVLLQRYRGRWDDRRMMQGIVVVVAILVILGGIRVATRPGGDTYPTPVPWQWQSVKDHGNGTWSVSLGDDIAWYDARQAQGSESAVTAVQASLGHRAFRFDTVGPLAIHTERGDGGWWVNTTAVLDDFELRDMPAWLPEERLRERAHRDVFVPDGPSR